MVAVTGTTLHWCGWDRKCNWCQSAWLQIPAVPLICWVPLGQATKQLCASSSLCVKWGWHTFHFTDNFHLLHRVTLRIKYKTALISAFLVLDKLSTSLPLCKYFWSGGWYHLLSIMAGGAGGMFRQRSVFFFFFIREGTCWKPSGRITLLLNALEIPTCRGVGIPNPEGFWIEFNSLV